VLALTIAVGLVWYLDESGILRSPNLFARLASFQAGQEELNNGRFEIWGLSLRQIMLHPLFGSGPEGFYLARLPTSFLQAHNFVLQFLLEFGVIGCALAAWLILRAVKRFGGAVATATLALATPANRILACLLTAFLGYALIDQMMYHLLPLLQFALFAGLFAAGLMQAYRARRVSSLSNPSRPD
jgi:O-antigen ligase